ncbi:MAG: type II secretion system F family protein [Candidatus ainarchaeum sp.]|nr:type II secretion system F family protein [Candidatus ainarchaeum sp.]
MEKKKSVSSSIMARVVRKKKPHSGLASQFLPYFPEIRKKISLAGLEITPHAFLDNVIKSSVLLSISLIILTFILFSIFNINYFFIIPLAILYPPFTFWYLLLYLDIAVIKKRRLIDYEIVFAVRHIVIALRSGMPLFNTLVGVSVGYGELSKEFNKIVEKVTLGTPLSQSLREAAQNTPSKNFSRVLMQIANSLSSGSDVADSLEAVLNQISRDQVIELKAYGRKLTPLVMFFMIFGIILPSLGIAFAVILLSLIAGGAISQSSYLLMAVFAFILLVQYLFLAMVEGSRPHYAI